MDELQADAAVRKAINGLLASHPFYAFLALRLRRSPDPACKTGWTDGEALAFNPEFIVGLTPGQRATFIAHEAEHNGEGDPWRLEGRDADLFNRACDYRTNLRLKDAGFEPIPDWLCDERFRGMSPEQIYPVLEREQKPPEGGGGQQGGQQDTHGQEPGGRRDGEGAGPGSAAPGEDPGGCGAVRPAPAEPPRPGTSQAEWRQGVLQAAAMAKTMGDLPAGAERLVARAKHPSCQSLLAALEDFVTRGAYEDYSWRRGRWHGDVLMPRLDSQVMPPFVLVGDSSGSITREQLAAFAGIAEVLLAHASPEEMVVAACDAAIHRWDTYRPGDEVGRSFPGGGGTDFCPIFERIEQEGMDPACVVVFTDLAGRFPAEPAPYPTLWCVLDSQGARRRPPFGEVIYLDDVRA